MQDPIAFLDHAGDDWALAVAVVRRARDIQAEGRHKELTGLVDAIGKSVGNQVARQIGRMLSA